MAYLGEQVKKLGFGLMRLPKLDDETIDLEQVKQMVDLFLSKTKSHMLNRSKNSVRVSPRLCNR